MDDDQLDALLARERWSSPPVAPAEAIWRDVERAAFDARSIDRSGTAWWPMITGLAAALIIGVVAGRATVGAPLVTGSGTQTRGAGTVAPLPVAEHRAVEALLSSSAVLFAALPQQTASTPADIALADKGAQLLVTVRTLLDSRASSDPRIQSLLADLELVLVQVVGMQATHPREELLLIHHALDTRDIVPRLRSAAARYSMQLN